MFQTPTPPSQNLSSSCYDVVSVHFHVLSFFESRPFSRATWGARLGSGENDNLRDIKGDVGDGERLFLTKTLFDDLLKIGDFIGVAIISWIRAITFR